MWSTASELNSSHFDVERRHESESDFRTIAKVIAEGTTTSISNYHMNDYDISLGGTFYYRLRQVDFDGEFNYSDVISLRVPQNAQDEVFSLYPNPAIDQVKVELTLNSISKVKLSIWDASGKMVIEQMDLGELNSGQHNRLIDVSGLNAGVYQVQVDLDGSIVNKKLIVLRK